MFCCVQLTDASCERGTKQPQQAILHSETNFFKFSYSWNFDFFLNLGSIALRGSSREQKIACNIKTCQAFAKYIAELLNINVSLSIQYQLFSLSSYQYQYQYQLF